MTFGKASAAAATLLALGACAGSWPAQRASAPAPAAPVRAADFHPAAGGSASAPGNVAGPLAPEFERLDRNGDGYVRALEAAADAQVWAGFERADTNNDGKLSRVEYHARF